MKIEILDAPSLAEYLKIVESFGLLSRVIFRGQGNSNWKLVPSLYRLQKLNHTAGNMCESYALYESIIVNKFIIDSLPYIGNLERGFYTDRIIAQHFGVPTRILDWSRDPLVALYFAVEEFQNECDSAVFLARPHCHFMSLYEERRMLDEIAAFSPPPFDRRIEAQKSIFTVHDYGLDDNSRFLPIDDREYIEDGMYGSSKKMGILSKIVIPAKNKLKICKILLDYGIDRRTLFPGMDGVGANMAIRSSLSLLEL